MGHGPHPAPFARSTGRFRRIAAACCLSLLAAGCLATTFHRGYVFDQASLDQVPAGSSQEQVLLVLGTPSTVATVSGEAFYYISQTVERKVAFLHAEVVDQRVLAVYFDQTRRVERIANYGLKDGKVFDFISRSTATGGQDLNLVKQILSGLFSFQKN
jgi:outer membrane protein assembly factor BamE (lipoprotein component of BamABCDE complex)